MTSPAETGAAAGPRAAARDPTGGFSLIELLVVLAVMGFVLALIVGYRAPWSSGLSLEGTAAELASGLRLARSQAIADNRPVAFALDLAGHRYRVGGDLPRTPAAKALARAADRQRRAAQRHRGRHPLQPRRQLDRRPDHACRRVAPRRRRRRLADRAGNGGRCPLSAAKPRRVSPCSRSWWRWRSPGWRWSGCSRPGSGGLFAVDTAARAEEALQRAQSHLAAVGRDAALVEGDSSGDDGGGYRWRLQVQPAAQRQGVAADGVTPQNATLVLGRGRDLVAVARARARGRAADAAPGHAGTAG